MDIRRYESPFDCDGAVDLLAGVFGRDEALLEKPQLDGSEAAYNKDVMFIAYEDGKVVGTIHATFPKNDLSICGISGMCTHPSVRGTGLGRILFEKIVKEADETGAEYIFLGTENPAAAKLYHSCGFSYLPGTNVMARFRTGGQIDMDRKFFQSRPAGVLIHEGTPAERIPLIPFVMYRSPLYLMDINTGIFTTRYVNQYSCMGLYPRYEALRPNGGNWYVSENAETGIPGALLSLMPCEGRIRADFFYADGFQDAMMTLLDMYGSDQSIYYEVSLRDQKKQELLLRRGYHKGKEGLRKVREFEITCAEFEA